MYEEEELKFEYVRLMSEFVWISSNVRVVTTRYITSAYLFVVHIFTCFHLFWNALVRMESVTVGNCWKKEICYFCNNRLLAIGNTIVSIGSP